MYTVCFWLEGQLNFAKDREEEEEGEEKTAAEREKTEHSKQLLFTLFW